MNSQILYAYNLLGSTTIMGQLICLKIYDLGVKYWA